MLFPDRTRCNEGGDLQIVMSTKQTIDRTKGKETLQDTEQIIQLKYDL